MTREELKAQIEKTAADDDKEAFIGEDIAKLKHQGMLLEKVPEKYITVEVDRATYDKIGKR